jgi:hypothetical protein
MLLPVGTSCIKIGFLEADNYRFGKLDIAEALNRRILQVDSQVQSYWMGILGLNQTNRWVNLEFPHILRQFILEIILDYLSQCQMIPADTQ